MIRHLVHLQFRNDVTIAQKQALYARLAALKSHLPGLMDVQYRDNISVENALVRGFKDMFWCDFDGETSRNAYLDDPAHQEIGAEIVAHLQNGLESVFVCDIEL